MAQKNGGYYDPDAKPGDYRVIFGTCCLTGEQGKVISALTHVIDFDLPDGGADDCQIWCQYSAEGLQMLMRALAEAPFPAPPELFDGDGIRANLKYYWHAFYEDGESVRQWAPDPSGGPAIERHFGHLDPARVVRFYLLPKEEGSDLPCYCLDREQGFLRAERRGMPYEAMVDAEGAPLPLPAVPWHLEYCFRPHVTLMFDPAHHEAMPVHVRQELGWRVDTLHGDPCDTWFLLGIEDDDGSWQVLKKTPEESRHFQRVPWEVARAIDAEPRLIEAERGVRIVEAYG